MMNNFQNLHNVRTELRGRYRYITLGTLTFDFVHMAKVRYQEKFDFAYVLYGCETWSLTLREERRLRVFENRVLRRISGPKRDKATGEWRKLHNEELTDLYCSPNIVLVIKSRRMR